MHFFLQIKRREHEIVMFIFCARYKMSLLLFLLSFKKNVASYVVQVK